MNGSQRWFIFFAMACGFFISAEYAIVRPVSNSVFIAAYSSQGFPYAWLALVPLNFLVIALYNKYLPRLGCFKTYAVIASIIVSINVMSGFYLKSCSWLPFFLYVWKEIYVMLMFQQLWSVIHSTISLKKAKYLYGILFGIGALGAVCGSLVPGLLAVRLGSESLLFTSVGIYALLTFCYYCLLQKSTLTPPVSTEKQTAWTALQESIGLIRSSKILLFILVIVVCMQVSSCLIDFQFNHLLEEAYPGKDARTAFTAKIMGSVHMISMALQFFGSFLLVHFLGFRKSHLLIPAVLLLNGIGFFFIPTFTMISLSFITIKSFDFSLFGVIKEMLYIPLNPKEKFHAKSIIDVVAYRSSKAVASLLILAVQGVAPFVLRGVGISICVLWGVAVLLMFKIYEEDRLAT